MIETSVAVGEVGAGESGVNAAVRTRWGGKEIACKRSAGS